MLYKETIRIVRESAIFKDFIMNNPDAKLCAGFFIIDFFSNDNKRSLDYMLGDIIYTFDLKNNDSVLMVQDKLIEIKDRKMPELKELPENIAYDLEDVKTTAQIISLDNGISSKFNKIIAVLQNLDDKNIWNLTCMLEGLIILNILIDADSCKVIKFEKKSMMDLIRKK
jgi:hypothetical protein